MSKASDVRIVDIRTSTQQINYRQPMKFGGRVVEDVTLLDVDVEVETRTGRRGRGHGSMPLGNVWAWPSQTLSNKQTLAAMFELGQRVAVEASSCQETAHPLEITSTVSQTYGPLAESVQQDQQLIEPIPVLAQLVAASPWEAAVFDAQGKALGINTFNLLGPEHLDRDLSGWLGPDFRGKYLDEYTRRQPQPQLPLYHLVGAMDPLTRQDQTQRLDDGWPETLEEWIAAEGLTHMKIKLNGDHLAWDVQRVVSIEQVASKTVSQQSRPSWVYSLDFNEKCESVQYVLEFLQQLRQRAATAFRRVQYIEQPTHRDLKAHPEQRMHEAAQIKPVVIDESLVDLESLLLAREMGYSGVALKACKGQREALLMGAAAQRYGMFLCVQDLTCPGASFLHSASLAARIPTVAAIEGNGRQYCPAGNVGWQDRFPTMFQINDGTVGTAVLNGPGLGY